MEGDAVGNLQGIFIKFWNETTGQSVSGPEYYPGEHAARNSFPMLSQDTSTTAGHQKVGVIDRNPRISPRIIHDTFVKAIDNAHSQIQIINPYLTLCRHIKRSLKKQSNVALTYRLWFPLKATFP